MAATQEANKTAERIAVFGAVSTIVTYLLTLVFPDMPETVRGAILVLVLAGIAWTDNYIHNSEKLKLNGLWPR